MTSSAIGSRIPQSDGIHVMSMGHLRLRMDGHNIQPNFGLADGYAMRRYFGFMHGMTPSWLTIGGSIASSDGNTIEVCPSALNGPLYGTHAVRPLGSRLHPSMVSKITIWLNQAHDWSDGTHVRTMEYLRLILDGSMMTMGHLRHRMDGIHVRTMGHLRHRMNGSRETMEHLRLIIRWYSREDMGIFGLGWMLVPMTYLRLEMNGMIQHRNGHSA